tara:strand:+ start:5103 stop:5810 length:708 start_codon:yes stop_codon:yes gene_type:complete
MPNWVYSGITISTPLTKKQEKILEKIKKTRSICDYYIPRDKEISETRCPANIVSQKEYDEIQITNKEKEQKEGEVLYLDGSITQEMSDNLIKKYGANNWYDWSNKNWGTKWGDCDLEIEVSEEVCTLRYESAWSPLGNNIMEMFRKDFPNFEYTFEEEQGWGARMEVVGGEIINNEEWDVPLWDDAQEYKGEYITKLESEHPNYTEGVGYYLDYGYEYVGETLEDAKEYINEINN